MKRVVFIIAVIVFCMPLSGQNLLSFRQVRSDIDAGLKKYEQDTFIEGIITGEPGCANHEKNVNTHYTYVSTAPATRTTYIQTPDGKYGFKLRFLATKLAAIPRYSHVRLNIKGADLLHRPGEGYTLWALGEGATVSVTPGAVADVPVKERTIATLTDDDLYTFVTLKDCEFFFKDGSLMNVYEPYLPKNKYNAKLWPGSTLDTWAQMLLDKEGNNIYYIMNGNCPWHREGDGVPQGSGYVSGILTNVKLERYGDCLGKYQIIPISRDCFAMDGESSFKTIAEWNWSDNAKDFQTDSGSQRTVISGFIKADSGDGWLSTTTGLAATRGIDMNNLRVEDASSYGAKGAKGMVSCGALTLTGPASAWWDWENDKGNAIQIDFSTEGITGENLVFAWSFAAGSVSIYDSYDYPAHWRVEYSTDGTTFHPVPASEADLHSYPWWWNSVLEGERYMTSAVMGLGMTEHFVRLPKSLFGCGRVSLRLVPSCKKACTLGYENNDLQALRPNLKTKTVINFGSFAIRYN